MQYSHILSYIGGKFYIANWVISHFPKHVCYVEPFGGAAHILLRKHKSKIEVYNDVNKDLVNLFMVARNTPEELIASVDSLPYARSLYEMWVKEWKNGFKGTSDLEWATRYFYLANNCFSGKLTAGFATGTLKPVTQDYYNGICRINRFTTRMKSVLIENRGYCGLIKQYDSPDTLFYCDPPYIDCEGMYDFPFTIEDHIKLADTLNNIQGKALVSYYPNPLLDKLYQNWKRYETTSTKHSAGITSANPTTTTRPKSTEILLSNRSFIKEITDF